MATQKPISTISYNTEAFLREKLDIWVNAHIIQAYMYICHKGEDGDKDHIHLRIEPNKKLDPMDLTDQLREFQIGKDKPLGVRPWRNSKEEDWFLYVVHDADYLKLKYNGGEKGEKIPYDWQNIKASEGYDVEVAWTRAKASIEHGAVNLATRIVDGENPLALLLQGENPYLLNQITKLISGADYTRLQAQYDELRIKYNALIKAVQSYGLEILSDGKGGVYLERPEDAIEKAKKKRLKKWTPV